MLRCRGGGRGGNSGRIGWDHERRPARPSPVIRRAQKLTLTKKKVPSKRTRAARARAAQRAQQLQDAQKPRFKFDESGALVPDIRAEAAIIYDPKTGQVLWEQNSLDQRSIASITKVMTATVILEDPNVDLSAPVVIERSDVRAASTTYLRAGYKVTKDDLLHLLLIGSDNAAARALARTSPYGSQGFVEQMNEKAEELGLQSTSYVDPSGLFNANLSSAYDMARLISYVSGNDRISKHHAACRRTRCRRAAAASRCRPPTSS